MCMYISNRSSTDGFKKNHLQSVKIKKTKIQKAIYNIVSEFKYKKQEKNLHCNRKYFKEFGFLFTFELLKRISYLIELSRSF